ncbi:MAG: hypothetical protein K2J17_00645 [Paramuribaculum sp.]|nr:hypothetical protein [Paramuribaculum sp.]
MKRIHSILQRIILPCICVALAMGCTSTNEPEPPQNDITRTVLVYMVANNNLSSYASQDFKEMLNGMAALPESAPGRLLVYYAPASSTPELREVMRDGTSNTLKSYSDGLSSVDAARMREVIEDARSYTQADSYGLVLWSHGTGWLHDYGTIEDEPEQQWTYSFGSDGTPAKKMSIESLNRAIDGIDWDFIYFDCCHMGTVEVAYELRHRTPVIVACATELGLEGMPYDLNVAPFFAKEAQLDVAMGNTFDYYDYQYRIGYGYGCSISLIRTANLDDLASHTRKILETYGPGSTDYQPVPYFRKVVMSTGIYDMRHYIESLCTDESLLKRWADAFDATVAKHSTTAEVYTLPAKDFHGLGCQIITYPDEAETYNYKATSWWKDVVSHATFNTDNQ